jgi:UDP-glucose 4-epimerase
VIEIFRQHYLQGAPLPVNAPGTQRRIFTHINDIVDGLVLVGEKGEGDEFGLGADAAYSILEVAHMFGSSIDMRPEVQGNRMNAVLDTTKARAIGWRAQHKLADYIESITSGQGRYAL